jgi:hypothetical protein
MFFAGKFPHKILKLFFAGLEGFYGFGLWEVKMLWVWTSGYGNNIGVAVDGTQIGVRNNQATCRQRKPTICTSVV